MLHPPVLHHVVAADVDAVDDPADASADHRHNVGRVDCAAASFGHLYCAAAFVVDLHVAAASA